jgi:iron complex outermembrane receptor protein
MIRHALGVSAIAIVAAFGPVQARAQESAIAAAAPTTEKQAQKLEDMETIVVTARLDESAGIATLGDLSIIDTPLSVASYDRALLDTVLARNIAAVTRFDPAVTSQPSSGGFGAAISIRGFDAGSVFDGLPTPAVDLYRVNTALFATERLTVLRGVSSLVYAGTSFTPIGGVINLEPKRPRETALTSVTAGFADRALGLFAVDASRRLGPNDAVGIRVNLGTERGHGPIDLQDEIDNTVAAVTADIRLTPTLTLSGGGQYSSASVNAYRDNVIVAPGFAIPRAPRLRTNAAQPWGEYPAETTLGHAELDWQFAPGWSASVRGIASSGDRSAVSLLAVVDAPDGSATSFPFALGVRQVGETVAGNVSGQFSTGAISHRVTLNATTYRERQFLRSNFGDNGVSVNGVALTSIATNLYRPVHVVRPDRIDLSVGPLAYFDRSDGAGASWTATYGPVTILGAARFVWLRGQSFYDGGNNTNVTDSYDESKITPLASITLAATAALNAYASYAEGLELGTLAPPGTVNANQRLPVRATRQIEAGLKWQPRTDLLVTLAAFETTRPQEFIDASGAQPRFVQAGRQRHRGIELAINGKVTPTTRIVGGALLLDPIQLRTGNPLQDGNRALGVPDYRLAATVTQDIAPIPGLSVTVAAEHVGRMFVDVLNERTIPSWTRVDAGLSFATRLGGQPTRVSFFMDNVFGERYWAGTSFGALTYGAPEQTWRLSVTTDF